MPDPLTGEGLPNGEYDAAYMQYARALGRAVWGVFGERVSPDFIVERTDQSTLHFSTFVLRDYTEGDDMPSGIIVARAKSDLSLLGSHMYRATQAREVIRLMVENKLVMEQEDLEITDLKGIPGIQQKMLDGTMTRPKGVALVQADRPGRTVDYFEAAYLGKRLRAADPNRRQYLQINVADGIGILSIVNPGALNALNSDLVSQLGSVIQEIKNSGTLAGETVKALIIRGSGRAFVAGADVKEFAGNTAANVQVIAGKNIQTFSDIENLPIPVIALVDGFALGGGNELAMSTHYCIVTENAQLGQPEIKLGIIPGYGGLQRLPRLVGPRKAAEMSVNGEPVDSRTAIAIGLADEFAVSATALRKAVNTARMMIAGEKPVNRRDWDRVAAAQMSELTHAHAGRAGQGALCHPPTAGRTGSGTAIGPGVRRPVCTRCHAIRLRKRIPERPGERCRAVRPHRRRALRAGVDQSVHQQGPEASVFFNVVPISRRPNPGLDKTKMCPV
jgi:enoyl-CoA hydratase/carnithine racemase